MSCSIAVTLLKYKWRLQYTQTESSSLHTLNTYITDTQSNVLPSGTKGALGTRPFVLIWQQHHHQHSLYEEQQWKFTGLFLDHKYKEEQVLQLQCAVGF